MIKSKPGTIIITHGKKKSPVIRIKLEDGRWQNYSTWIWEHYYGEIPKDSKVIFLDHNPLNCNIENLYCIKLKYLLHINAGHLKYYDKETLETCINIVKLRFAMRSRCKDNNKFYKIIKG